MSVTDEEWGFLFAMPEAASEAEDTAQSRAADSPTHDNFQKAIFWGQEGRMKVKQGTTVQWRTQEFWFGEGAQQIKLMTEDRENGNLGAVVH